MLKTGKVSPVLKCILTSTFNVFTSSIGRHNLNHSREKSTTEDKRLNPPSGYLFVVFADSLRNQGGLCTNGLPVVFDRANELITMNPP